MYQILSPNLLTKYSPDQYYKSGEGVFLKEGVQPIAGTTKTVANKNPNSLEGTLPAERTLPLDVGNGEASAALLPGGNVDQLTALRLALRNMSQVAYKQGLVGGTESLLGGYEKSGYAPSKVSGATVKGIIDFVEGQVAAPIQQEYQNLSDIIDSIGQRQKEMKDEAYRNMVQANSMIESSLASGAWDQMDPEQRQKLWEAAGFTGDAIVPDNKTLGFYQVQDDAGHVWQIAYDTETGDVIRKQDLGQIGTKTKTASGPSALDLYEQQLQIQKLINEINNPTVDQQTAIRDMATQLNTQTGEDGYVSPDSYRKARTAWVTDTGLSAETFDSAFANYRNPANPWYGVD